MIAGAIVWGNEMFQEARTMKLSGGQSPFGVLSSRKFAREVVLVSVTPAITRTRSASRHRSSPAEALRLRDALFLSGVAIRSQLFVAQIHRCSHCDIIQFVNLGIDAYMFNF